MHLGFGRGQATAFGGLASCTGTEKGCRLPTRGEVSALGRTPAMSPRGGAGPRDRIGAVRRNERSQTTGFATHPLLGLKAVLRNVRTPLVQVNLGLPHIPRITVSNFVPYLGISRSHSVTARRFWPSAETSSATKVYVVLSATGRSL